MSHFLNGLLIALPRKKAYATPMTISIVLVGIWIPTDQYALVTICVNLCSQGHAEGPF